MDLEQTWGSQSDLAKFPIHFYLHGLKLSLPGRPLRLSFRSSFLPTTRRVCTISVRLAGQTGGNQLVLLHKTFPDSKKSANGFKNHTAISMARTLNGWSFSLERQTAHVL